MSSTAAIHFHYQYEQGFSFRQRNQLKAFLVKLAKAEGHKIETINYIFCSDDNLLELNQSYLKHNTLTDIITFPFSTPGEPILSDIYISIDRIKENARLFNTSFTRELHRVIFHGLLHLCGFKDKSASDTKLMRLKEDHYLNRYLVPRGTN